jgi:hypothetical protein
MNTLNTTQVGDNKVRFLVTNENGDVISDLTKFAEFSIDVISDGGIVQTLSILNKNGVPLFNKKPIAEVQINGTAAPVDPEELAEALTFIGSFKSGGGSGLDDISDDIENIKTLMVGEFLKNAEIREGDAINKPPYFRVRKQQLDNENWVEQDIALPVTTNINSDYNQVKRLTTAKSVVDYVNQKLTELLANMDKYTIKDVTEMFIGDYVISCDPSNDSFIFNVTEHSLTNNSNYILRFFRVSITYTPSSAFAGEFLKFRTALKSEKITCYSPLFINGAPTYEVRQYFDSLKQFSYLKTSDSLQPVELKFDVNIL